MVEALGRGDRGGCFETDAFLVWRRDDALVVLKLLYLHTMIRLT